MTWRPSTHFFTYLVAWDDLHMIKAGVTSRERWKQFCGRGARLVLLHGSDFTDHACALEQRLERELSRHRLTFAFPSREAAAEVIGGRGSGYLECLVAKSEEQYVHALASCASIMRAHGHGQCSTDVRTLMHGRTDARTHVDPPIRRYEPLWPVTRELQADSSTR